MDNPNTKKRVMVNNDDISIVDGKLIIANAEAAKAFEDQEFSLDAEEGDDVVVFAPTVVKV